LGLFLLHRSRPGGKPAGPADAAPLAADYRLIAFGIFWFFITLLVESSVIPIVDVIFEHRVYLPSVGMFIAAATALDILFRMVRARRPRGERAILAVLAVIIVALGVATYQRNTVWQTGVTLWEDVVAKSPNKARAHNILGFAYARERLFDQAREQYLIALRLQPDYFESYFNLGVLYLEMGRRDDARTAFESVLKLQPDHQQAMRFLDYVRGTKQK
jgi:tetratricopeptide (TPR) repeat protein